MSKRPTPVRSISKPTPPEGKPPIERPHKTLSETQEEIADLASHMLLYGGDREDVDLMLLALARHQYRSYTLNRGRCEDQVTNGAKQAAAIRVARWYAPLRRSWSDRTNSSKPSVASDDAKPVTEMVRMNLRESARNKFEEFLGDVEGIEPVWVLNELLNDVNNGQDLGQAIWYVMDRADIYVRVPYEHKKRVQEFIALLTTEAAA